MLVVTRYRFDGGVADRHRADLQEALDALSRCPGFLRGVVGRATDDAGLWVLSTQWRGVGDYRRALSSYDVKMRAVAVLARAVDEPTAFETLVAVESGPAGDPPTTVSAPSGRAADADQVALGEASSPQVPTDLG